MAERRGIAHLFEGWQVGAIAVFLSLVLTLVIVPRTAEPSGVPPSSLTPNDLDRARIELYDEARAFEAGERPRAVDLFDARFRELGLAELAGDEARVARWAAALEEVARPFLLGDISDLRTLRAAQAREFASAYLRSLREGHDNTTVEELGGATLVELRRNGWLSTLETAGSSADIVLVAFFKRRFDLTLGVDHPSLAKNPLEERALVDFLLRHPPVSQLAGSEREARSGRGKFRLAQIDALSKLEPGYPAPYARGVVFYEMGQFDAAATSFDAYLSRSPSGPYRLRAVNYLKASVEESNLLQ